MGSYSVDQWVRHSMGQSFYCSAADAGAWEERGYGDGSGPYAWLSSIALLPWLPGFPPLAFPTMIFSLISPQSFSTQSIAAVALCSTIPKLQLPSAAPSRRPVFLSGVCLAAASTVWFSFHLGCHRSAVSLSALNVSPLTQTIAPMWGLDPCFSSPTRRGQVQSY